MADFLRESSSDDSLEDEKESEESLDNQVLIPAKDPAEQVFDDNMSNVNKFLQSIAQFEKSTNNEISDLWHIKDLAFQPLRVQLDIQEYIPGLFDILKVQKQIPLTKVLAVFCYLEIETANLTHEIETRFFDPLIYFGENGSLKEDTRPQSEQAGEIEIATSRILPVLNAFYDSLQKVVLLSKNCLLQMNGLFHDKFPLYKESFKKQNYYRIFDNLGTILTNLYIVDLIIKDNISFEHYWQTYNAMFAKVKSNPDAYTIDRKMLKRVVRNVEKVYGNILAGNIYEQVLSSIKENIRSDFHKPDHFFKNKAFQEKFLEYLKWKADRVQVTLGSPGSVQAPSDYMTLLTNYSMYKKLFEIEDTKFYAKIWSLQKQCPLIILYNNLQVNPGNFLSTMCFPKKKVKVDPANIQQFLAEQLQDKDSLFPQQIQIYYMRLLQWITFMNSDSLKDSNSMLTDKNFLKIRANQIHCGIQLATEIKRSLKLYLLLFQETDRAMPKASFPVIIQAIEMLKAIEIEFKTKKFLINKWVILINRYTCEFITRQIERGMQKVYSMKAGQIQQNMMELMMNIIQCYKGGYNELRKTVIQQCINLVNADVFSSREFDELYYWNQKLEMVSSWEVIVRKATRCRFLYWHRALFPILFNEIINDRHRLNQMNYFLMALKDPLDMIYNIKHLQNPQTAVDNYKKEIYDAFAENVISPICKLTENELRNQIHQVMIPNLNQINPMEVRVKDLSKYARMNDLYLFEKQINMGYEIKKYLSAVFYEMTALSPHDFCTYEQMRSLASEKLGINVMPSHLPAHQLDQGIDIMMLMAQPEHFVRDYCYNLYQQVFIQETLETKQVRTIGVNQMLYSIRTHGVGILSSVMRQLYKFLRKQLGNFCKKFLLDDQVKNMLLKQAKRFNRDKEKFQGKYPTRWANEFARALQGLAEGEDYLQTIRKRITQIGNTLGFVRMIKNASLKDNQNLLKYLPSLLDTFTFESVANDLAIGGETLDAVKMFDSAVNSMQKQGEDANDYMRKIIASNEGFTDANESMAPLKNFYTLIPAVTTCHINHVVIGRNKLKQNNNKEAFISDDGFALGIAFLLRIFSIDEAFRGLNWFESIQSKLEKDVEGIQKKQEKMAQYKKEFANANAYEEEDDKEEEALSIKQKEAELQEYNMLSYQLSASAILFKEI